VGTKELSVLHERRTVCIGRAFRLCRRGPYHATNRSQQRIEARFAACRVSGEISGLELPEAERYAHPLIEEHRHEDLTPQPLLCFGLHPVRDDRVRRPQHHDTTGQQAEAESQAIG
jgi:hypothetical protein